MNKMDKIVTKNIYNSLLSTLKILFNIQDENISFKYLIVDSECLNIMTKLYNFKKLIQYGITSVFDIDKLLPQGNPDNIDEQFKYEFKNKAIYYFIMPTDKNLFLIRDQLSLFKNNVNIVFADNISDQHIRAICTFDVKNNIVTVKSVPLNIDIISGNIIISNSNQLSCFISLVRRGYIIYQMGYDIDSSILNNFLRSDTSFISIPNTNTDINKKNDKFRDIEMKSNYGTIIIMLNRNYDRYTSFMIPWYYESMLQYYFTINNNYIIIDNKQIRLDTNDKIYEKIRNMPYGEVIKFVTGRINELNQAKKKDLKSIGTIGNINNDESLLENLRKLVKEFPEHKIELDSLQIHIQILNNLNKILIENDSFNASELQNELVCNNMSFDDLKINLQSNPVKHKRSLVNVMNIAYILFFNTDKLNELIELITSLNITLSKELKQLSNEKNIPVQRYNDIINTKTKIKKILKPVINFTNLSDFTNFTDLTDSIYLHFKPPIKNILDCITKKSEFNSEFMQKTFDISKIRNVIIHVNDFITYEEKRIINTYIAPNDVNFILHSYKLV